MSEESDRVLEENRSGAGSESDPVESADSSESSPGEASPDEEGRSSLEGDLRSIRSLLERTGRRDRLAALLEGGVWYVAAFGAVAVSAALLGVVAPSAAPSVTGWILLVGCGVVAVAALGSLVRFLRRPVSARGVARRLQRSDRSFRNDLVAALEFGETLADRPDATDDELGFSRRLGREHVRRTLRQLGARTEGIGDLADRLPDRPLTPPLSAVAGGAVLLAGFGLAAPDRAAGALGSPFETASSSEDGGLVRPIVGDIRLTYAPPRYTGEGTRTESHSTGHIETVAGSEVTLTTYPLMEVASVEMVIESGGGERVVPLRRNDAGQLKKELVLTDSGEYHFRATLPDGTEVTDGMTRRIELKEDSAPSVAITSHEGSVEVSPEDRLELEFRAEDDYGLEAVERVHYFGGASDDEKVRPVDVPSLSDVPKTVEGTVELDLRSFDLEPKDVLVVYLQATDNNTRTGPGIGESDKLRLRVASVEDKHLEIVRAQRQLSQQLLSVLGDYLEHPVGERVASEDDTYDQIVDAESNPRELADRLGQLRKILRREEKVFDEMKSLLGRMRDDPLMVERNLSLFEGLHEQFRGLHERGVELVEELESDGGALPEDLQPDRAQPAATFAADMEANLEKGVLRLLEMVASQKMDAVQATRKDIDELKNRLEELMKRYKESNDPELKESIEREIGRLKQRMSEMMRRMQMQIRDLPEKHLNEDALREAELKSGTEKLSSNLESMEKKFEEGDIDGALEQLEQMSSNLSSFGEKMDQQFSSAQPSGMSKLDERVSKLMDDVNDLKSAEKRLEEETKQLKQEAERERREKLDEMLDSFTERMKRRVDEQLESLDEMARREPERARSPNIDEARESMERLKKRLDQKDVKESAEAAREALEKLRRLRFNKNLAKRQARSGSERREAAEQSVRELEEMIPRGRRIQREIEQMMERAKKQLGAGNSREMERLARKQKKVSERAGELERKIEEASKEFPMLKQKLQPSLEGAKEQMSEAERRLSEGKSQGALDSERSALQKLGELEQSMRRTMQKKRQQKSGGSGMRRDEVEIPDQGEDDSQESLRREVMEAMKEENMETYDEEIQRYYKSLVE